MPAQKEDPEILAMKRVMKALQGLSTNQRYRVLAWVEGKNNETATVKMHRIDLAPHPPPVDYDLKRGERAGSIAGDPA